MKTLTNKSFWITTLLGLLVITILTGHAVAAPEQTTGVTVPAAAFRPKENDIAYNNVGWRLEWPSTTGCFYAPVYFPEAVGDVRVRKIWLYAYDNDDDTYVAARLWKTRPFDAARDQMAYVSTSGPSSTTDPVIVETDVISYRVVQPKHGVYLDVCVTGFPDPDVYFYAVKIIYSH